MVSLPSLPRKVKVEITDDDGTTYFLGVRGKLSQDKLFRMMQLIDQIGERSHISTPAPGESTLYGKILKLIQSTYQAKEFSSADIARDYEDQNGSPIPLSTVSTYLSRLADKGTLSRQKFGNSWVYSYSHREPANQLTM